MGFILSRTYLILSRAYLKISLYIKVARLHKPIGISLLLWPTLMALFVAAREGGGGGRPNNTLIILFTLGVILMRSAGCVINDIFDRKFDPLVTRTANRPLALGTLSLLEAGVLFCVLVLMAFVIVLQFNLKTIGLSIIALLLAIIYPLTKRFTHFPQVFLGAAFAFGIPMAFSAQNVPISLSAIILFSATVLWSVVYDTQYAMVDREDDLKIGIKSTAILFGNYDRVILFGLQCVVLGLFYCLGQLENFGRLYYGSLVGVGLLFAYQQYLIRGRDKVGSFKAFLNNHWVGMIMFLGVLGTQDY